MLSGQVNNSTDTSKCKLTINCEIVSKLFRLVLHKYVLLY